MKFAHIALAASLVFLLPAARGISLTEWRAEELLMQAADAKKELALTDNQNLLWERSMRKTRVILRARKERRELIDAAARKAAADPVAELRALAVPLQDDAALLHDEDRELREAWLTVNDALDDRQRKLVLARFRSTLERQPGEPGSGKGEGRPERGGRPEGGGRGQGPGGMGGAGSGGISIGSGRGF
ncbi:hypothetical protein [Massilia yuzhufengensis]|uniref:LTXXQ motif family protein n=1 Tax=Massilia yuzhufengensis TaxID=1164594 RepID=A0A1I1KD09_9BURK|nr:hypothetical protein [Massilia yuzhufengensis]SFC56598.1 hypothetical protein SAMN05216204_107151 [Massilia yuzhufengensis]